MLNINITLIWGLIKFFTSRQIHETAEATEFKQRESKLQPDTFLKEFTIGLWDLHEITLTGLASKCEELQYQLILARKGLFKRVEAGARFLKELLNQAMEHAAEKILSTETVEVLKQFKDVNICDSSAVRLPNNISAERIRKARKSDKTKGKDLTKAEIKLLAWNLMISNIPADMLGTATICELYRIRWQVELIFKCWRGVLGLIKWTT